MRCKTLTYCSNTSGSRVKMITTLPRFGWNIDRDKDSVAERGEFELAVPTFKQPEDSWWFRSSTPDDRYWQAGGK
jgi:hypothetical protein